MCLFLSPPSIYSLTRMVFISLMPSPRTYSSYQSLLKLIPACCFKPAWYDECDDANTCLVLVSRMSCGLFHSLFFLKTPYREVFKVSEKSKMVSRKPLKSIQPIVIRQYILAGWLCLPLQYPKYLKYSTKTTRLTSKLQLLCIYNWQGQPLVFLWNGD